MQSVRLKQGPWQRHQGVADLHVDTGASSTAIAAVAYPSAEGW
ncbi:PH domain-containing protein [Streptomyces albidoflavus]